MYSTVLYCCTGYISYSTGGWSGQGRRGAIQEEVLISRRPAGRGEVSTAHLAVQLDSDRTPSTRTRSQSRAQVTRIGKQVTSYRTQFSFFVAIFANKSR